MADQKITELPIKTSSGIAATDYLLGIDSAEGYQMLIQDLGNYIINNVQATLGGTAQTLAAAIGTEASKSAWYAIPNASTRAEMLSAVDGWLDTTGAAHLSGYLNSARAVTFGLPVAQSCYLDIYANSANFRCIVAMSTSPTTRFTYFLAKENGVWADAWIKVGSAESNSPHFGTGTSTAGTLLATDTDINQLLTGEYYWASASYRPSANIPDNTAVRGRLWALDSGGQDIYCAQICYTSNFNWYIRYCTSKSSYTWTEWKRINAGETEYASLACSYGTLTYKCYKTGRIVSLIATIDVTSNIPANSDVITGLPFTGQTANYTPIRAFNNTAATYIDLDVHRSGSSACALSTRTAIASGASIRINATYTTE